MTSSSASARSFLDVLWPSPARGLLRPLALLEWAGGRWESKFLEWFFRPRVCHGPDFADQVFKGLLGPLHLLQSGWLMPDRSHPVKFRDHWGCFERALAAACTSALSDFVLGPSCGSSLVRPSRAGRGCGLSTCSCEHFRVAKFLQLHMIA